MGLCEGNLPMTGEFPAQMANNAACVSIWLCHHVVSIHDIPQPVDPVYYVLTWRVQATLASHYVHLIIHSDRI